MDDEAGGQPAAAAGSNSNLFDRAYRSATSPDELQRTIRRAAFGEDLGQFSWTTADEQRRFHALLGLGLDTHVLDVASGSGGPALFMVRSTGCRLTGVDIHDRGVATANAAAVRDGLDDRARFLVHDARDPYPFDDAAFDVVVSFDSINHVFDRAPVFAEWRRVLRPGGQVLYTDAVVVTGPLRREEILARSASMGEFVFTPAGADEARLHDAGFVDVRVDDLSDAVAGVAQRWFEAREGLARELDHAEGPEANAAFQSFLENVHRLAAERRLSRFAYSATKPA